MNKKAIKFLITTTFFMGLVFLFPFFISEIFATPQNLIIEVFNPLVTPDPTPEPTITPEPTPTPTATATPTSTATPTATPVQIIGGGGGGGGGGNTPTSITQVIFIGKAYPGSQIFLLKDAQMVAQTISDPAANFKISISGLSGGSYVFSIYGEDRQGRRSNLFTFPISITSGVITQISNIFIAPTIDIDKQEVKRGDNLAIFGQSTPKSEVTISINSEEEIFRKINVGSDGSYFYNLDTSVLEAGSHLVKSKAALLGEISTFSKVLSFVVGSKTVLKPKETKITKADINKDGKVTLVDFSVAAYWYKKPSPPASADLNGDGKVTLTDFSIMAYYWTGK